MSDVVIDFYEAKRRLRAQERVWPAPPIRKTLALAEEFRRQLDSGKINQAGLSHMYGVSRPRVTQVLHLLKLHPDILAFLRSLEPGPHAALYTERRLRPLLPLEPEEQLREAPRLLRGFCVAPKRRRAVR